MPLVRDITQKLYFYAINFNRALCYHSIFRKILKGKQLPDVKPEIRKDYKTLWKSIGRNPGSLFLKCMISISGVESPYYVTDYIYYTAIEPILNYTLFSYPYNDKNFYERYLSEYADLFPRVYLRGMNSSFYDKDYKWLTDKEAEKIILNLNPDYEYILKLATESGAGKNVSLLKFKNNLAYIDGEEIKVSDLLNGLRQGIYHNFVLQERIKQSDWFGHIGSDATNIIRIFTYRSVKTNEVHILHSYFRYAYKNEKFLHYLKHGGLRQGISPEGFLDDFAMDYYGNKFSATEHVDFYKTAKVPHYEKMVALAREIGSKYTYHRLLGFDFIVDSNEEVRVLELNTRQIGRLHHQMIAGPLFGEFTNEVVEYCRNNKKSPFLYPYYK